MNQCFGCNTCKSADKPLEDFIRTLPNETSHHRVAGQSVKCGYVEIFRGAEGGCRLSADLGAVTLYDLLRCIDEDLFVNACMSPDYECAWRGAHCGECRFHSNLAGLQRVIEDELKRRTVGAMLG